MTSQFLINEPPMQVLPTLAQKIGLKEAIVLQQVHYWLNLPFSRSLFEDRYWVRYTSQQWQRQFPFWDEKTIRRTIDSLEKRGVLISFLAEGAPVKYYAIDYGCLDWIGSLPDLESPLCLPPPICDHTHSDAVSFDETKGGN